MRTPTDRQKKPASRAFLLPVRGVFSP